MLVGSQCCLEILSSNLGFCCYFTVESWVNPFIFLFQIQVRLECLPAPRGLRQIFSAAAACITLARGLPSAQSSPCTHVGLALSGAGASSQPGSRGKRWPHARPAADLRLATACWWLLLLPSRLQPLGTTKARSEAFPSQCTSPEEGEGAQGRELPGDRRSQVLLLPLESRTGGSAPQPAAAPLPPPSRRLRRPAPSQLLTGGLAEGAGALGSRTHWLLQFGSLNRH